MIDVFERIRYVKEIVQAMYPKITREEIRYHLKRIARMRREKISEMSEKEQIINSLLLRHNIKPSTAHTWYRVLNLPLYLQQEIQEKRLSMTEAFSENLQRNRPNEVMAEELRAEIIGYVEKIAQNDFLRGGEYANR